jgi:SET domain-containing protein
MLFKIMKKPSTYLPLPKQVEIQQSKIHGMGVFAKVDIKNGTELGITHVMVWQSWIRTPLGGFINHSDTPNAKGDNRIKDGVDYRILIITKDVKAGEEITFFYTLDEYKGVSFKTNRL